MTSNQPVSSVPLWSLSDGTNVLSLHLGHTGTGLLLIFTCNGAIFYGEGFSDLRAALLQASRTEARLEARGCTEVDARSHKRAN